MATDETPKKVEIVQTSNQDPSLRTILVRGCAGGCGAVTGARDREARAPRAQPAKRAIDVRGARDGGAREMAGTTMNDNERRQIMTDEKAIPLTEAEEKSLLTWIHSEGAGYAAGTHSLSDVLRLFATLDATRLEIARMKTAAEHLRHHFSALDHPCPSCSQAIAAIMNAASVPDDDRSKCAGCAKVRRHPGEGYQCALHPHLDGVVTRAVSGSEGVTAEYALDLIDTYAAGLMGRSAEGAEHVRDAARTVREAVADRVRALAERARR